MSERTIYDYINKGLFDIDNTDLRRKVRRKPNRKKSGTNLHIDKNCHVGRTYTDFQEYAAKNPQVNICEMDTVEGRKGGTEVTNPVAMEINTVTGEMENRIFYCDPQQTNQKSQCERNHELIRYIFPKGTSFDELSQKEINLIMNHVNSMPRGSLNAKAPVQIFKQIYGEENESPFSMSSLRAF